MEKRIAYDCRQIIDIRDRTQVIDDEEQINYLQLINNIGQKPKDYFAAISD